MIARGKEFNLALCEVLGLDPTKTRSIMIKASVETAVEVTVEQFAEHQEGTRLVELVKRYTLTPRDE